MVNFKNGASLFRFPPVLQCAKLFLADSHHPIAVSAINDVPLPSCLWVLGLISYAVNKRLAACLSPNGAQVTFKQRAQLSLRNARDGVNLPSFCCHNVCALWAGRTCDWTVISCLDTLISGSAQYPIAIWSRDFDIFFLCVDCICRVAISFSRRPVTTTIPDPNTLQITNGIIFIISI